MAVFFSTALQSGQSRPRSEECQQWPTPTLDNPSDNSSLCFYPRQINQWLQLKQSIASAIEITPPQVSLPWPRKLMIRAVQIRRSRHTKVQVTGQDADSPNCKED